MGPRRSCESRLRPRRARLFTAAGWSQNAFLKALRHGTKTFCTTSSTADPREAHGHRLEARPERVLALCGGLWDALVSTRAAAPVASLFTCAGKATAMSLLPAVLAALFLARGYGQSALLGAALAMLGTVALGAVVVHLGCRMEAALHMLLAHAVAPVLAAGVLALPLATLVRWLARRR